MKLAFVIKSLTVRGGGAERVLVEVASGLAARGHEVSVVTFHGGDDPDFYPLDPRIERVRLGIGRGDAPSGPVETVRRGIAVRRLIARRGVDAAIGFMHSAFVPLSAALAGTGIPVVASEHIVYGHYASRPLQRVLLWLASGMPAAITAISEEMRRGFPARIARRMTIVPNPVRGAAEVAADPVGGAEKRLLSVGRLDEQKDQATLIEAFARLAPRFPDWRLRIVGEGVLRPRLEAQVAAHGLGERIALPGSTRDIDAEYRSAQAFVLPSTYESFGLATAEALAHGLPVVGFADCPGTNELVVDGLNGLLVSGAARVDALAEALARLMGDPELRVALGRNAPASMRQFAPERVVEAWETLLASVVASDHPQGPGR
jgi:glycosyltransferase involved in cell wall biosynthesis